MLSSNYDKNCTSALLSLYSKIDMDRIFSVVDDTPLISDIRKDFYKKALTYRKTFILDRAYSCCIHQNYDKEALERILLGKSYDEAQLKKDFDFKNLSAFIYDSESEQNNIARSHHH